MTVEGESIGRSGLNAGPVDDVLHIASSPLSPESTKTRFIVEPQVLNAALDSDVGRPLVSSPTYQSDIAPGGLHPPPRPSSRKGRPPRSTPSSPATSGEYPNLASFPNTPLSSPYRNSLGAPAVRSPRLSNFLRGDTLLSTLTRRASLEGQGDEYDIKFKEAVGLTAPWSPRDADQADSGSPASPLASLPSSPEMLPTAPADVSGPRSSRQNRYLSGLQKITKLGKAKGSSAGSRFSVAVADASVRSSRRMSDADIDMRSSGSSTNLKKGGGGSEDLSSRYRRMLDRGVRTAGELMKASGSASVPSSPISAAVKNGPEGDGPGDGDGGVGRGGSGLMAAQTGRAGFSSVLGGAGVMQSATTAASPSSSSTGRKGVYTSERTAQDGRTRRQSMRTPRPRTGPSSDTGMRGWANPVAAHGGPSPSSQLSHARHQSAMAASGSRSWPSLSPPSESSHEPPSSLSTEPRISISSTIYPSSSNNHSFDIPSYPSSPPHGRSSSMSPDRESFIDLASPTLSPRALDSQYIGIPSTTQRSLTDQPSSTSRRSGEISHVKSPVRASSTPSSQSGSTKPRLAPIIPPSTGYDKPPIPTAPKPDFSHRSRSSHRSSPVHTKKSSPMSAYPADHVDLADPVFSSSNALTPKERAERIRTTRKLAQVFGQPPGVSPVALEPGQEVEVPNGCLPVPVPLALNLNAKRRHHRPVNSLSEDVANTTPVHDAFGAIVWPPPDGTRYVSLAAHRRHSAPLSPDEFSFVTRLSSDTDRSTTSAGSSVIHIGSAQHDHASERASTASSRQSLARPAPGSPTSFIDLSDEEGAVAETPKVGRGRGQPFSPSTASLAESLTSDELAEEERRRKREKLAKLHRFLGSRVPPDLVLGPLDGTPLPPPAPSPLASFDATEDADVRKVKMRRRRSSSAAEFSRTWSDDIDRLKQGLNEREKAINVRRAIKMEKMFGVAPPQTLYHTRAPTVSTPNIVRDLHRQPSPKPAPKTPASPPFRFATSNAPKTKKSKRPGTGDSASSARPLIAHDGLLEAGSSSVYIHYRHSLNSLSDIIDRDDKESLAELHDYLTGNGELYSTGEQYDYQFDAAGSSNANNNVPSPAPATPMFGDDAPVASPSKAERRRSLPSRVSVASFSSEISALIAPTPTEASFQQRRRRAAKLTHFFGVDYRDLMNEVLESIEKGLEEERGKGTLRPDEVKDLQQKLVTLKTRRISLAH